MNPTLLRTLDVFLGDAKKPLIAVVGATACGKTSLSIEIAKYMEAVPRGAEGTLRGEVINADSRQLYRYLDIGTAKITEGEMHGIPHHLLSIKDPKEEVTVGKYQEWAIHVIEDILSRKKIPILVGGSMLYIASITDGYEMTKRLKTEVIGASSLSGAACYAEPFDRLRVNEDEAQAAPLPAQHDKKNEQKKCSYDLLMIGVSLGREELKKRIARRVDEMMEQGWIEEVRDLLSRGHSPSDPCMESHGYREICEFLEELEEGKIGEEIEEAKERLKQRITTKTCRYAKRQLTWWRNDQRIHWVNMNERCTP